MRIFEAIRRPIKVLSWALGRIVVPLVVLLNVLGLVGFFVRDRSVLLAFLLYLPLLPIGAAGLCLGAWRHRSIPRRLRCLLILTGLLSTVSASLWMFGRGPGSSVGSQDQGLSLLHWNVLWGGFWNRHLTQWESIVEEIVNRNPDILVLSEAPPLFRMYRAFDRLPGRRFIVSIPSSRRESHAYHLFVLARWPVRFERRVPIVNGAAAVVQIDHPEGPVRLMVVDGQSRVTRLRTPMLQDIARACAGASDSGQPIDLVVGDFNAVSRSIGFDALERAGGGYHLASRSCVGWRGSWPSPFPVFDIDHVWVRAGWQVLGCRLFTNFATDHRGQIVSLVRPRT
jgi:endonuclease/exonuclease/phosphatase family metal-dependent hydrolase